MPDLTIESVSKHYGSVAAVQRASFEARSGRILGLLGPNGAGKTSAIRMIAHIIAPDSGQIRFGGRTVGAWSQRRMGYLPEERGLYKKLKIHEQLEYLARLKGMSRFDARERSRHWLKRFDLEKWASKKTQELSKGMQQKVQFIATVLPEPDLVILDEPFSGLDPINAELLRDIIGELKSSGRTILFASHRMEQVEQLCDDICLISRGHILVHGSLRDVKRSFGRDSIILEFDGNTHFLDPFLKQGAIRITSRSDRRVELRLLNGAPAMPILRAAVSTTRELYRYELVEPSLTEIFISVVERQSA